MILQHDWQRVGVQLPEPGTVAPRPGDTVVIKGKEIIVPDPPSSSGEEHVVAVDREGHEVIVLD